MPVRVVTPPVEEPLVAENFALTGFDVKDHLRVDGDDDDAYIDGLITAAREYAENFQERAFVTQTLELTLDAWPSKSYIVLPRPPLQSVVSITYTDKDGVETVWDASNYIVDSKSQPGKVVLAYGKSWPSVTLLPVGGITIQYVAGYGGAAAVPQRTKQALLLIIGHWYTNRETVITGTVANKVPMAAEALLWADKVF